MESRWLALGLVSHRPASRPRHGALLARLTEYGDWPLARAFYVTGIAHSIASGSVQRVSWEALSWADEVVSTD